MHAISGCDTFKRLSAPAVNKINQKSQQQVKKAIRNAWFPILGVEMGLLM